VTQLLIGSLFSSEIDRTTPPELY